MRRAIRAALALGGAGWATPLTAQAARDPIIDTVVVVSHNVFDPPGETPPLVARIGNALHITTHPAVIRRLLLVSAGAPLDSARLVESARALREVGVFRAVEMDTFRVAGRLALRVETGDGWSTSPQLNFSSSAGSTTWSAALVERNFLGTATFVSLAYGHTPDRSSTDLQLASPGLLVHRAPLLVAYSDLSDGRIGAWSYGIPFYRTDARWSLVTFGEAGRHRVLDFLHDSLTQALVTDSAQRQVLRFGLQGGIALAATARSYLRLWAGVAWRREDFDSTNAGFAYSGFGNVGVGLDGGRVRYRVFERINGFGRREDVDLSSAFRLGVWLAPRAWGYPAGRAGIGPTVAGQVGAVWSTGLALLRVRGHGVFGSAGLDSGLVEGSLDVVGGGPWRQAVLLHLEGAAREHPKRGSVYDPWATQNGPRGFGAHAFTGNRLVYAMIEDRIVVARELWGVLGLGVAPYVEYGGAWYAGLEKARLGGDVGMALRFGSSRASRGDVTEFDVSYRFGDGFTAGPWALTFRRSYTLK